jgi:hypothetical protein
MRPPAVHAKSLAIIDWQRIIRPRALPLPCCIVPRYDRETQLWLATSALWSAAWQVGDGVAVQKRMTIAAEQQRRLVVIPTTKIFSTRI